MCHENLKFEPLMLPPGLCQELILGHHVGGGVRNPMSLHWAPSKQHGFRMKDSPVAEPCSGVLLLGALEITEEESHH